MKTIRPWLGLLAVAALLLCSSGCATIESRTRGVYPWNRYVYPATRMDFGDPFWPSCAGLWRYPPTILLGYVCIGADIPISLITDTALLPYDLYSCCRCEKTKSFVTNALYSATTPSPADFKAHYDPRYGVQSVDAYLRQPLDKIHSEKVAMLIRAEVGRSNFDATRFISWLNDVELAEAWLRQVDPASPYASGYLCSLVSSTNIPVVILERMATNGDERVQCSVARNPRTPVPVLERLATSRNELVLGALVENRHTPPAILEDLAQRGTNAMFFWSLTWNPGAPPALLERLWTDTNLTRRAGYHALELGVHLSLNPASPDSLLRTLAATGSVFALNVLRNPGASSNSQIAACETLAAWFTRRLARNPGAPPSPADWDGGVSEHIGGANQMAQECASCPYCPARVLDLLADHPESYSDDARVAMARNPNISPQALEKMAKHAVWWRAMLEIAGNPKTGPDALAIIVEKCTRKLKENATEPDGFASALRAAEERLRNRKEE